LERLRPGGGSTKEPLIESWTKQIVLLGFEDKAKFAANSQTIGKNFNAGIGPEECKMRVHGFDQWFP